MSPATLSPSEMGAVASIQFQKMISSDLKEHYLFNEIWKSKISLWKALLTQHSADSVKINQIQGQGLQFQNLDEPSTLKQISAFISQTYFI